MSKSPADPENQLHMSLIAEFARRRFFMKNAGEQLIFWLEIEIANFRHVGLHSISPRSPPATIGGFVAADCSKAPLSDGVDLRHSSNFNELAVRWLGNLDSNQD